MNDDGDDELVKLCCIYGDIDDRLMSAIVLMILFWCLDGHFTNHFLLLLSRTINLLVAEAAYSQRPSPCCSDSEIDYLILAFNMKRNHLKNKY